MTEEKSVNQQIAELLGWKSVNRTTVEDSGFPFEYTELYRPDGTLFTWDGGQCVGISGHDQQLIWEHAPDYLNDLNASLKQFPHPFRMDVLEDSVHIGVDGYFDPVQVETLYTWFDGIAPTLEGGVAECLLKYLTLKAESKDHS